MFELIVTSHVPRKGPTACIEGFLYMNNKGVLAVQALIFIFTYSAVTAALTAALILAAAPC